MANFPKPSFNRIIESDPQIVKVAMDLVEWGARPSLFAENLGTNPKDPYPSKPGAPEISIQHVSNGSKSGKGGY
jgi:hypothetical protein